MSSEFTVSETLDVTGLSCPLPVLKTKEAADGLAPGAILEVIATDVGSVSDIRGWATAAAGVELIDQVEGEADGTPVYRHYVRATG